MSRNYYAEINLHITWHTKGSSPLLVPKVEAVAHHALRGKCVNTPGVFIHAVGGIETHVHLCLSIPPTLTISDFVGQLKGYSSHEVNQKLGSKLLEWQTGYGVVSFGTGDLEWVKAYVLNQSERHATGQIVVRLERITELEDVAESRGKSPVNGARETTNLVAFTRRQRRAYTAGAESPLKGARKVVGVTGPVLLAGAAGTSRARSSKRCRSAAVASG